MSNDPFSEKAAENFLEGGGLAAKWPKVGFVVEGTVTGYSMQQQTDYDTGEPLFWDGKKRVPLDKIERTAQATAKPVMQMLMDIQGKPTGETWEGLQNVRVAVPDDDGMRTAYVKGALQTALKQAIKTVRGRLETGAYVRIERIADGPQSNPKFAAPHRFSAVWTPAAQNPHKVAEFMEDDEQSPF